MKRNLFVSAFLVLAFVLVTAPSSILAAEPYKIGVIFEVTGPYAPLGAPAQEGVKLAVEMINQKGGINGRPLTCIYYDNQNFWQKA